jgi:hypothetical protein
MPVAGRKPKPDGQKRNRHAPTFDWVEVPNVPFVNPPDLPPRPGDRRWSAHTKRWWKAVSGMPHCALWTEADWSYAFDTAIIAAQLHDGDIRAAAPLERREKVLGTTLDYRRDLRIRYVDPDAQENADAASVTSLTEYRDMVADG